MGLPDYTELLSRVSYIEGIIRMVENYGDPLPLEYLIRDPEMEDLIKRHFHCSSGAEFLQEFRKGNYHKVMDQKFAGASLLFHTRKCRDEHILPNAHLLYCVRGKCILRVRQKEVELTTGDTCIVAADVPHSFYNTSEDSLVLHAAITAAFASNVLLPRLPQEYLRSGFFREIVFRERTDVSHLFVPASKVDEMTYFLTSAFYNHLYRPMMYEEIVNSFMLLFFSYLLQAANSDPELADRPRMPPEQTLQQIMAYITANCRTVTLCQLAEQFHFNESYLSQYLKKNTGQTFTVLLQGARISAAEKLLINTNHSVVDIAAKVGYQNMSYFYKLFNEVNHCSPAEYRGRFLKSGQRVIGQETL